MAQRSIDGVIRQPERRSLNERRLVVGERTDVYTQRQVAVPSRASTPQLPLINDVIKPAPVQPQQAIKTPEVAPTPIPIPTPTDPTPPQDQAPEKPTIAKRRRQWQPTLLIGLAVVIVAVTGVIGYQTWRTNVDARDAFKQPTNTTVASANTAAPTSDREGTDETPVDVDQKKAYAVSPDMPRILAIPGLGVEARVLRMNLRPDGAIQAPQGIWDTGWYDGSAKPGEPGNAFIDGHVSGPTEPAVFSKLKDVAIGTEITIERGDGSILTYLVRSVETVKLDEVDMKAALALPAGMTESLTVMTCGGGYLGDYTYDSRVIVRAERI